MAIFTRNGINLYYEVHGTGYPVLLLAPGGMRSAISFWAKSPWNPIEALAPHFQVIAMDQRNAGKSTAPISGSDDWTTYTADHLALLDHLGIASCHVLGGCIGGSYCFGLIQAASDRISAAVIQQTIGFEDNQQTFYEMFDGWASAIKADFPAVSDDEWQQFRSNMYDGDFVFSVDRAMVRQCSTPLLVLMGDDVYHPQSVSRQVADLAPEAQLMEQWKDPVTDHTVERVLAFLQQHAP